MAPHVRTLAATYYGGHHIAPHAHPWGQLIYADQGVMRVNAGDRLWIVPSTRAIWAPPGSRHEIWAQGAFAMRTLYLAPRLARLLPAECRAIMVGALLRELVLRIIQEGMLDGSDPKQRRLIGVLIDLLLATETLPLSLKMPGDKRARNVAERLQRNPSDGADLEALAKAAGASGRTLQRLFRAETGLNLGEWRRRLRLLHAVTLLDTGSSVTEAGFEAGYQSTSAFVAAFHAVFGFTPLQVRKARAGG